MEVTEVGRGIETIDGKSYQTVQWSDGLSTFARDADGQCIEVETPAAPKRGYRFTLTIDLQPGATPQHLGGILYGVARIIQTASSGLEPIRYGVDDPSTMRTCGVWEITKPDPNPCDGRGLCLCHR